MKGEKGGVEWRELNASTCIPSTSVVNCTLADAGPEVVVTAATEHEYVTSGTRDMMCMYVCGPSVVKLRPMGVVPKGGVVSGCRLTL